MYVVKANILRPKTFQAKARTIEAKANVKTIILYVTYVLQIWNYSSLGRQFFQIFASY